MRNSSILLFVPLAMTMSGCGSVGVSASPDLVAATGPHGGRAVLLPGGAGYGEVVVEHDKSSRPGPASARLVVYFLKTDLKTPLSPAPLDVRVKAVPPNGEPATVPLTPQAKRGDAMSSGRFASAPGNFDFDELQGDLTATVAGQTVTRPFSFH
ncbi:MAG TPA: hypothetical protein VGZ22_01550 [Isosphaeraceae bacterium]|jgi:hypothetical protein|nr:hypothetical protein [Isosphaeraceae bacterium]